MTNATANTLGIWTHPATGEIRVYCNTAGFGRKVWLTENTDGLVYDIHHKGQ